MPDTPRTVSPGSKPNTIRMEDGRQVTPPADWALLAPGDATLTRRIKAAGPSWTVQQKKGRRTFSQGVWAPAATIEAERVKLEAERETPEYKRRLKKSRERRAEKQEEYVEDFHASVVAFLGFSKYHAEVAERMAAAVTAHATPVGSGTVARTSRIPVEERAEKAVIAWMRHQTTGYDDMKIQRVKGKRRQVRRQLAEQSRRLLELYRRGAEVDPTKCPLARALNRSAQ